MSKYVRQEKSLRKHPVTPSTVAHRKATAIPANIKERPDWKGPGFVKKSSESKRHPQTAQSLGTAFLEQEDCLSLEIQQLLLDIVRIAFPICQEYDFLKVTLNKIRVAILEGDFGAAYSQPGFLEAYTVRWSPNRALCYANVILEICNKFPEVAWVKSLLEPQGKEAGSTKAADHTSFTRQTPRAVCFGGGPTEIMAFAALLRQIQTKPSIEEATLLESETMRSSDIQGLSSNLSLVVVDMTDWTSVTSVLETGLQTPPPLSKFASQKARDSNTSFIPPSLLKSSSKCSNMFTTSSADLVDIIGSQPILITLFFTLDDLIFSSTAKTAAFWLKLTLATPRDSLLLVIDKPDSTDTSVTGSSADIKKPKYSIDQFLDFVLLDKHNKGIKASWESIIRDKGRLYKMKESLKFPVSLDNFKFQVHLFKRI